MAVVVERAAAPDLLDRLARIQAAQRPGSRAREGFRAEMRAIALEDHQGMLLSGVDRDGKPRAPLGPATLADRRRGPGPSLVPRGAGSRFFTNVAVVWEPGPGEWSEDLVGRYHDIESKSGVNIVPFHRDGTPRMPARNTHGLTPAGMARMRAAFARLPVTISQTRG